MDVRLREQRQFGDGSNLGGRREWQAPSDVVRSLLECYRRRRHRDLLEYAPAHDKILLQYETSKISGLKMT